MQKNVSPGYFRAPCSVGAGVKDSRIRSVITTIERNGSCEHLVSISVHSKLIEQSLRVVFHGSGDPGNVEPILL